jgi:hypothetical protein
MEITLQLTVERGGKRTPEHQGQFIGILPVHLSARFHIVHYPVIEFRAGQRVRYADADIGRHEVVHHFQRGINIFRSFPGITELQEKCRLNSMLLQEPCGFIDLFHARAFFHGIENLLGTTLRSYPYGFTSCPRQVGNSIVLQEKINT